MIFIVSNDSDESTNIVIKWIYRYKKPFIRTGTYNWIKQLEVISHKDDFSIRVKMSSQKEIDLTSVESFWFRKSRLPFFEDFSLENAKKYLPVEEHYRDYLFKEELPAIEEFFIHYLQSKNYVGDYFAKNGNKLSYFFEAKRVGFKVPDFLVSNNLDKLKTQMKKQAHIIKPVQDLFYSYEENVLFKNYYSNEFSGEELDEFDDEVFPTMVQGYLDKKYEIRTFYLKGEVFSMAIFSQSDKKTEVDFRNYNDEKPNRMIPYKLPKNVELKIDQFMKNIGLNTGSLDFILTKDNELYFLEVNPAGQYGMIEGHCFYGLDKKIAENLAQKNTKG